LYEDLDTKFERLENIFGIFQIEHTQENFEGICRGELDLGGKEALVKQTFSSHLSTYMDTWDKLDGMLSRAMSETFRTMVADSFGRPYVYSWFCVDHVGYVDNPRRRTLGYHAIFDHYRELLKRQGETRDGLHWHFHPMSTYQEAHRCATSLINSPHVFETLARRIIERRWFPSCCRSGFQTERPDIHWFLEQYIPFDFSNTSVEDVSELEAQADLAHGRFGDWRLAPKGWSVYHPSHDNYQLSGHCRRWIGRALNVLNRFANINVYEVEKAFVQAEEGRPTLLCVASHDFRDLTTEVDYFRSLLVKVQAKYPEVKFRFCEAHEAFRRVVYGYQAEAAPALELSLNLHRDAQGKPLSLTIDTLRGKVFGPQPFLAIKTRSRRFIHDNLDFSTDLKSWRYAFDAETVLPDDLAAVGIGANDEYGNTFVNVQVIT
jgi:hypothetical protein